MEKKRSIKKALGQLGIPGLRAATGGGRLRVPVGYTDTGEPIYAEGDEPTSEYARIWKPG